MVSTREPFEFTEGNQNAATDAPRGKALVSDQPVESGD